MAIDRAGSVSIRSRIGTDKTAQFPEIADTLARIPPLRDAMLDGEIVAVGRRGEPLGFPRLERRTALTHRRDIDAARRSQPAALVVFDVLRSHGKDLRALPFNARRAQLERLFHGVRDPMIRVSTLRVGDGRALYAQALRDRATGAAGEGSWQTAGCALPREA